MADKQYLDKTGLARLWELVKQYVTKSLPTEATPSKAGLMSPTDKTNLDALVTFQSTATSDISALKTFKTTAETDIATLKEQVKALQDELKALKEQVGGGK